MSSEPEAILTRYAIGTIAGIKPAGGTAGKCWRIRAGAGRFFLRRRGPRTSAPEAMSFDHALRRHLIAEGVPTSAPVATVAGETWVVTEAGAFELHPFVAGRTFRGGEAELVATARALAGFHQAAARYAGRGGFTAAPAQFALTAPEVGGSTRLDDPALIAAALAARALQDPALAVAAEEAQRLACDYAAATYGALPRWLIHGDYHPGNLLYTKGGAVAGIFDLDWACEDTRSRDLADLLYFFAGRRREPLDCGRIESLTAAVELDLDAARLLLRAYHDVLPLTPSEVRAVPLALRARWLAMRLEGSAKVAPEQRSWFLTRDLTVPLRWLDRWSEELTKTVAASR